MIPKHLTLRNFLSHDLSKIDFSKFNTALILGTMDGDFDRSNSVGKSAIFEAITWALFDRSRHKKKDDVVKWDRKACKVEFEFWIDSVLYKVSRLRDKTASEAEVLLEQWNQATNQFEPISCDTNTLTNEKIIKLIGFNYEVFVNSVYFKQDDISIFATTTPTKRKDIIKSLLQIEQWDLYQKKTKDRARDLNAKIEDKSQRLVSTDTLTKDIEDCKNQLAALKKEISSLNQEYSSINSGLTNKKIDFERLYGNLTEDESKLKALQQEFSNAKKRLLEIQITKNKNDINISSSHKELDSIKKKIDVLKIKIVDGRGIDLQDIRSKIILGKTREKILKEKISDLEKEIRLNNSCDLCGRILSKQEIEEIRKSRKKELEEVKIQHTEIQQKLMRAEEKLKEKELLFNESTRAELEKARTEVRVNKLQNILEDCQIGNRQLKLEQVALETRDFKNEILDLKVRLNKEDKERAESEIKESDKQLLETKRKLDKLNIEYGSKVNAREELVKTEKEQSNIQEEISKLKNEYRIFDKLKDYFGRDGIQAVIIENVIEELENYTNDTLSKICNEPTSVSIATQKQNDNGSWAETFDINVKEGGRTGDLDALSGGGKFRVALSLRLALSSILAKRMGGSVQFLLLDEVATSLDKKGLETFMLVIKQLSKDMKILIITHDERLKEKFNDIIVVNKTAGGSKVVF